MEANSKGVSSERTKKRGLTDRIQARATRYTNEAFVDRHRDASHAALVLGSGRSGTTWIAEMLARALSGRLVFEPFHPEKSPTASGIRLFDASGDGGETGRIVETVLSGRARSRWMDQVLISRLPSGRVVKDIHATNLLPWFASNYPDLPIVFVIRHPMATSVSRLRTGGWSGLGGYLDTPAGRADAESSAIARWLPLYDRYRHDSDELVRWVAEWCIENAYPLGEIEASGALLCSYEDAVRDPQAELKRMTAHCEVAMGRVAAKRVDTRRPSAKDWFGSAAAARASGDWAAVVEGWRDHVTPERERRCMDVLGEFGLQEEYDGITAGRD